MSAVISRAAARTREGAPAQRAPRTRFGSPIGYVEPHDPLLPLTSHLWLLSWLLVASLGAVVITPPESSLAIWWPATFVGVGVLLQAPRRRWAGLLVVMTAVVALGQILGERGVALSAAIAAGTVLESLTVAWVLRRLDATVLRRVGDVARLLAATAAGVVAWGVALAMIMPLLPGSDYAGLLGQTSLSHVTAALCLGPLFLTRPPERTRATREQVAQWLLLIAVELWVFGTAAGSGMAFALLPVLLWGAVRHSPRATAAQSTVVAAVAVLAFSIERGPFRVGPSQPYGDWTEATIALQLFLSALALTALLVATGSGQLRMAVEEAVREAEFTRTVLGTTHAMTMMIDLDGRIQLVNAAIERATGFRSEDLVGRRVWQTIIPPDRRDQVRLAFEAGFSADDLISQGEEEFVTAAGEVRRMIVATAMLDRGDDGGRSLVVTGIDVTEQRRTSDLLSRMLSTSSSTAAIGIDLDGRISLFSRGAADLLGYEPEEAIGVAFTSLVARGSCDGAVQVDADADPAVEMARVCELMSGDDETPVRDWWWRCADGELVAVSQTIDGVTDGAGRVNAYLAIGRDVTETRRSQELLLTALRREREAVDRLRQLDHAKNEFVTTVSHELRTPVTSIVGYAEIFRDEVDDEDARPLVDAIARNGYRLRDLADALVTLSDLDNAEHLETAPLELRTHLTEVIAEQADVAAARGQSIVLEDRAPSDTHLQIHGDCDSISLALSNVIDNALKFSADGATVTVVLEAVPGAARIQVVDQGMGIPVDDVDGVFERFRRGRNAQAQAIQGPGLGLSLTRTIIRLHGGSVTLRSQEGVGTEVEVVLPLSS